MNTTTAKVLKMQQIERTSMEWDFLFQDIYVDVVDMITTLTNSYEYQLKGDIAAAESEAGLLLIRTIERFKYQGYEFRSFYSRALHNKLRDMIRSAKAQKNANNYGTIGPEIDFLHTEERYEFLQELDGKLETIYEAYSVENPEHGQVLETMVKYSASFYNKSDLTGALATYYGEPTYNGTIQKRVSRIREAFRKYALDHGFEI